MHVFGRAWRVLRRFFVTGGSRRRAGSADELCERAREQVMAALQRNDERMIERTLDLHRARGRALDLLIALLTPDQRQEFQLCRYFHVTGGSTGTHYRIRVASRRSPISMSSTLSASRCTACAPILPATFRCMT